MPESPESTRTSRSDLTSQLAELEDDDEKLRQDQLQQQRSTIPMAAFNFINSIIGSGIVGQQRLLTCYFRLLTHHFYARQLYRQVLLRARISYGNSVCLSVRLS